LGHVRCPWDRFCNLVNHQARPFGRHRPPPTKRVKIEPWSKTKVTKPLLLDERAIEIVTAMRSARANYQASINQLQHSIGGLAEDIASQHLLQILVDRRGFGVSDPRDMIFAHIGIVPNSGVQVNYQKPLEEVFENFARDNLHVGMPFGMLSYKEDLDLNLRRCGLASWAPDWTISTHWTSSIREARLSGIWPLAKLKNLLWLETDKILCVASFGSYTMKEISCSLDMLIDKHYSE
jgi:hypothetical protein